MRAAFPEAFADLFRPARYKVYYGGRGGAKSQSFARALLIQGAQEPLRILCTRATQRSIADSVHRLLSDQIKALDLENFYTVQKATIIGRNGTLFIFSGLKDAAALKSFENISRCWVEEGQVVPRSAWETLLPSIRARDAEIWVSMNPLLPTDDSYQRWIVNPPPNAIVRKVNFDANPWFPEVLRLEMEHCRNTDPETFRHVWEGFPVDTLAGAVFHKQLREMDAAGRVTKVPVDPVRPVNTAWDLGVDDSTAIWFFQAFPFGEMRLIDYLESSGEGLPWYLRALQTRGYVYGTHWLPHDGRARQLGTGKSIEELMRIAGMKVQIVPRLSVADRINAARTIFPQCWFDGQKCADGLNALRHYRYGDKEELGVKTKEPIHDWSSHGSDSFTYFAVASKTPKPPQQQKEQRRPTHLSAWS